MNTDICRYCGKEIGFIKCKNHHMAPVEPEPLNVRWDKTGYTYLMADGNYIIGYEVGDAAEGDNIREAWIKHAVRCEGRKKKIRRPRIHV